jgi:hypothetical protein
MGLDCPFGAGLGIAMHRSRRKTVESGVIGRMDSHKLALQMGRQFGDLKTVAVDDALDLVGIGL